MKGDSRRTPRWSTVRTASVMAGNPPMPEAMIVAVRSDPLPRRASIRLSECLLCGRQPEEDEPVDLALVLRRKDGIRIEAGVGVFF